MVRPERLDSVSAMTAHHIAAAGKKDPGQEFAERVAEKWYEFPLRDAPEACQEGFEDLVNLISSELRAEGWIKSDKASELFYSITELD